MADNFSSARQFDPLAIGSDASPHTPADTDLPGNVKAVYVTADCTLTTKNSAGTSRSFPAKAGIIPFVPARITAVSTGAVWLIQ